MKSQPRLHHLAALLLLAACGKSSTSVVVPKVTQVVLSPAASSVEVGLTLQFTAEAFDGTGAAVTGQPVTWTSSSATVASVDGTGLALGLSAGSTQIRATIGGVQASQTLTVTPSSCTVRTDVVLSPGQYQGFGGTACLLLPAGSAGDIYRVAVARPTVLSEDDSNVSTVTLSLSPVVSAAAAGPDVQPAPQARAARRDAGPLELEATQVLQQLDRVQATRDFEMEIWRQDRLLGLSPARALPNRAPAAIVRPDPPPPTDSLFVNSGCVSTALKRAVTRVGLSDNLVIYQLTSDFSTSPISGAAATMMLDYFESYVKDMLVAYWGPIPDIDQNGRIIVVTTTASVLGDAAAFVTSRDYYPTSDCASSNEGEVIYFDANLIRDLAPASGSVNYYGLGVVAHEAKHVISVYNGILRGSLANPLFHERWIEEGTAEISAEISSRIAWAATGGPAVNEPITSSALFASQITKENYAVVIQFAGIQRSLPSQPNSVMNDPVGASDNHSFYDMSWLWHRVLGDGFGDAASTPQADSALFRLLTSPSTKPVGGAAEELQVTGTATFQDLFEDFIAAVSLHGSGFAAPRPLTTWDFADLTDGSLVLSSSGGSYLNPDGSFPWPVTATELRDATGHTITEQQWAPFTAQSYSGDIGPSGVRFHDFRSSGSAAAEIRVTGAAGGMIVVTRLD